MKKLLILIIIFLFLPTDAFAQTVRNQYCLGIYGTFSAANWPGGTIDVGCSGDTGTAGCTGGLTSVAPGQSFSFPNCTCPPFADGCLKVGKSLSITQLSNGNRPITGDFSLPAGCKLTTALACGVNGNVVVGSFHIDCTASPTPTPTRAPTPTPTRTPTPAPSSTPTTIPTPTTPACVIPARVPAVRITCPNCTP